MLSTRFMPPLAVVVPVLLMYRRLDLQGTHLGLVLLYTGFNLSLAVWLMKGFIDEIPRAYEEAALVDGYSRLGAFLRVIVPQARDRHGRDGGVLPDLGLERVRLRDDAEQLRTP